ncbi:unnamed protein product [Ceutorhynchus assimilis]|uniref:Uncharacterized protein n=1 Tax=Ceutorhynchus assimilis TaxID=467358 RepID=A0A9N9MAL5_9CUCU|nr:unnamed protein product [Ceutorhynchus assimilis]
MEAFMKSNDEEKVEKLKPFKLCFLDRNVVGQSNIKIGKSLTIPPVVSPKFYDPQNGKVDQSLIGKYVEILKKEQILDKSRLPKTENQRYGWYQERLTDADPTDRRLFAHKRTNIIVREHLMNYAKIRE